MDEKQLLGYITGEKQTLEEVSIRLGVALGGVVPRGHLGVLFYGVQRL